MRHNERLLLCPPSRVVAFCISKNHVISEEEMKTVTLATTPLVKKILTSRYGGEPIRVERSDALHTYLQSDPARVNKNKYRELGKQLTQEIILEVSWSIAQHLRSKQRCITVGYHLHKIYQLEMIAHMEAQRKAGMAAMEALKGFLDAHQIWEDDYPLENAYTAWKRKRMFFSEINATTTCANVPKEQPKITQHVANISAHVPYDSRDIMSALCEYYETAEANMLVSDRNRKHSRYRKALCYLLKKDARMTCREIAAYIHTDFTHVSRLINEVMHNLDYYQDLQRDIARIRLLYIRPSAISQALLRLAL